MTTTTTSTTTQSTTTTATTTTTDMVPAKPLTNAPDLGIGVYIVEPKTDAAGMELHTILIISLVVLIVLICLGYYIWQKYFWEISCKSSRRPSQEDVGKGNYDALPQSDQPAP